jgi:hypothetical protein
VVLRQSTVYWNILNYFVKNKGERNGLQKEKTLNKEPGVIPGFIRHSMDETDTYYIASE